MITQMARQVLILNLNQNRRDILYARRISAPRTFSIQDLQLICVRGSMFSYENFEFATGFVSFDWCKIGKVRDFAWIEKRVAIKMYKFAKT